MKLTRMKFTRQGKTFLPFHLHVSLVLFDLQQWRTGNKFSHSSQAHNRGPTILATAAEHYSGPGTLAGHSRIAIATFGLPAQLPYHAVQFCLYIVAEIYRSASLPLQSRL